MNRFSGKNYVLKLAKADEYITFVRFHLKRFITHQKKVSPDFDLNDDYEDYFFKQQEARPSDEYRELLTNIKNWILSNKGFLQDQ